MKILLCVGCAIGVIALVYAETPVAKYEAQLTVKVTTDEGKPVENAVVAASTFDHWVPGEGFGGNVNAIKTATTDSDGMATIAMLSLNGCFGIGLYDLAGFYCDRGVWEYRLNEVKDGKWQPWNSQIDIVFKPIRNPIPMFAKRVIGTRSAIEIPVIGTAVAFDLMKGDWVAPHGSGMVADILFTLTEEVPYTSVDKPFSSSLRVSFSNALDGIQSVFAPLHQGSALRFPRHAPETGYAAEVVKGIGRAGEEQPIRNEVQDDRGYFFRVRTIVDEGGVIKQAYYGKIVEDIEFWGNRRLRFAYCLNPTSLDRNMEFDPKRNLFTRLRPGERVTSP